MRLIETCLTQLQEAAIRGQWEIKNGDIYRSQVSHKVFSEIVPEIIEDEVIQAMVASDIWWCGFYGFTLHYLTD